MSRFFRKFYKDFKDQKFYCLSVICSIVLTVTMGITFQQRVEDAQIIEKKAQETLREALGVEEGVKKQLVVVNQSVLLIEEWKETQKVIVKDLEDIHRELGLVSEIKQNRLEIRLKALEVRASAKEKK